MQVPGIGKVMEQTLNALEVTTCQHLLDHRGLLAALFSDISCDFFMSVGVGMGATRHPEHVPDDEPHRKGISCERTFGAMSLKQEMEEMVSVACCQLLLALLVQSTVDVKRLWALSFGCPNGLSVHKGCVKLCAMMVCNDARHGLVDLLCHRHRTSLIIWLQK